MASRLARAARRAVNSSGEAAIRSISAFIGWLSAEFKWISPRPSAHDEDGHRMAGIAGTPSAGEASSQTSLLQESARQREKFIVL